MCCRRLRLGPRTKDVNNYNVIHGNLVEDCGRLRERPRA